MEKIIDVKKIVEDEKEKLKIRVEELKAKGIIPKLSVILANNNPDSKIYVSKKEKLCEELGILSETIIIDEYLGEETVIKEIQRLNDDESVHGILLQLPLYKTMDSNKCINCISPQKDVDGITAENIGKLFLGEKTIIPCTAKGIMKILKYIDFDVTSKNVTIYGRSALVGKPMYALMLNNNAQVQICHTHTLNAKEVSNKADLIIVAIGSPKYIDDTFVKDGAIIIDVGINKTEEGIAGDVDLKKVINKVKYITKVPGGVGLTTVLSLIENVIEIAEGV